MTYRELLLLGEERLASSNIFESKNDAWLLFEHCFQISRHEYIMKMNDSIDGEETIKAYEEMISLRCKHIPLQHITGSQDFMGLTFKVNEHVLIPRQDTEILVDKVLTIVKKMSETKSVSDICVLDMCTGSGCISISISKLGNVSVTAVDISEKALNVAKDNARLNEASNVSFVKSNLFDELKDNSTGNICNKYDIIVSNPPYIPSDVIEGLMPEVKDYEPRLALDGTADGLEFYRNITNESVKYLKDGGYLLYEIGCEQAEDVKNIMAAAGYENIEVIKDLAGLDRVCLGNFAKKVDREDD
ncbi:MAG: peptide chain release factor N(5)-glutamine methyltransferase [Lachnospiraceae bacterium]|nr:peptide chain release factor N(5)-glutamine methyltransferase [Lachnospiraceae bacterium]MBQ6814239.1 peptide chain release factor N(5)-glutamine methyltransferase [Lachnospiraceae bacterium]